MKILEMMTAKIKLFKWLFLLSFLSACVSASMYVPEGATLEDDDEDDPGKPLTTATTRAESSSAEAILDISKSVDGYFYYIDTRLAPSMLTKDQQSSIISQVKEKLASKGFKEVDKMRKAYLTVYIYEQGFSLIKEIENNPHFQSFLKDTKGDTNVKVSYSKKTLSYQNGQLISKTETSNSTGQKDQLLWVVVYVNTYGKRPKLYYSARVMLPSADDAKLAVQSLVDKLDKDLPKAPKQNNKMKGDPGCTPRFGFQTQTEEVSSGKVIEIIPGSAAAKLGMRVGDIILAIDSAPYSSREWEKPEIYEKFVTVPIKFSRQNQIFRKTITAQIQCENK